MMTNLEVSLDKKIVHKQDEMNVLVKNLRRAIPAYFDKETAEKLIIPRLSITDRAIFLEYYILHYPINTEILGDDFFPNNRNKECYIMFNIPHFIDEELMENLDNTGKLTQKEKKILSEFYQKNISIGKYVLKQHISEVEGKTIYSVLNRKDIYISDIERFKLAQIINDIPDIPVENIFYSNLLINTSHPFFFEHSIDHVPGIMLMEAARQFTTACCHVFGKVPLRGVQFIMNQFNSKFYDYVDLNYPVGMKAELFRYEKGKEGEWLSVDFHVTIYQNGTICTYFEMEGRLINKKLFTRLREGRSKTNPAHRFYPLNIENCTISLWNIKKEKYVKAKLFDISFDGFRLELEEMPDEKSIHNEFEFIICFPQIGFIRGGCHLKWFNSSKEIILCGFHITKISRADKKNIKETIKNYCHLRTDREIF